MPSLVILVSLVSLVILTIIVIVAGIVWMEVYADFPPDEDL